MKTKSPATVTVNRKAKLYIIPCGPGYTCLGFQVCAERLTRLATELGEPVKLASLGSLKNYRELQRLQSEACKRHAATGWRAECELSPQLIGLERHRVEVVTTYGETRRFNVGRSTGPIPVHLEITRRGARGGICADRMYASIRVIR